MNEQKALYDLQILAGQRGDIGESAARIKHLQALVAQIPREPKSRKLDAAPTAEQYNDLIADLQLVYAGFNALRIVLDRINR